MTLKQLISHALLTTGQATVSETGQDFVWFDDVQYRSFTGLCAVLVNVHMIQLRLPVQLCKLKSVCGTLVVTQFIWMQL